MLVEQVKSRVDGVEKETSSTRGPATTRGSTCISKSTKFTDLTILIDLLQPNTVKVFYAS